MGENSKNRLFQVAESQQGYFTSQQAEECGYYRSHFHRYLESGAWTKEDRGIYRLVRYPLKDRPELVHWTLWSRDKQGEPQGVWSHETAMDIHDLSDVMPAKMHMTVPGGFRKGTAIPNVLQLHYGEIDPSDLERHQGYRVTTPLKTLIDVANEGKLSPDLIAQGLQEALQRGQITRKEITKRSPEAEQLQRIIDDYKI